MHEVITRFKQSFAAHGADKMKTLRRLLHSADVNHDRCVPACCVVLLVQVSPKTHRKIDRIEFERVCMRVGLSVIPGVRACRL
jgi:hypothetical protein